MVSNKNVNDLVEKTTYILNKLQTINVFKKDKRRQIKKGKKYKTRISTCT